MCCKSWLLEGRNQALKTDWLDGSVRGLFDGNAWITFDWPPAAAAAATATPHTANPSAWAPSFEACECAACQHPHALCPEPGFTRGCGPGQTQLTCMNFATPALKPKGGSSLARLNAAVGAQTSNPYIVNSCTNGATSVVCLGARLPIVRSLFGCTPQLQSWHTDCCSGLFTCTS